MSQSNDVGTIVVPKWGLTMEDAEINQWLKSVGDEVAEGEAVVEIMTDKVEGEVESDTSGILTEILAQPGDVVEPGQVIGRIKIK